MKTRYDGRGLISPYVNFIPIGQCGQQIYIKKFAGGGKGKRVPVSHPLVKLQIENVQKLFTRHFECRKCCKNWFNCSR